MTESFDLLIRGGMVATPNGIAPADVGVIGGRIAAIGALPTPRPRRCSRPRACMSCPGVMDTQVHFREPGNEHKEDLDTGSLAAILGGVTGVFEMPNTAPPTTTRAAIEDKLARAKGRMHCDHAFYAGATPQNIGALAELEKMPGVCGIKAFLGSSTGTLLLNKEDDILAALKAGKPPRRGPFRRRRPHDRAQASGRTRQARDPSGLARCRSRAHVHRAGAAPGARSRAAACMCCMSPPATRFRCWPPPRISPPPKPRRSISRCRRRNVTSGWAPMRR